MRRWVRGRDKAGDARSTQQPQSQGPSPQQDRCIMLRARPEGKEARGSIGEGGVGEWSTQQPQSQGPTPQQNRCIMLRTRPEGREASGSIGEGGVGVYPATAVARTDTSASSLHHVEDQSRMTRREGQYRCGKRGRHE